MAQFNYFLNRQGARGRKGDKGEQGFSPIITEETDTALEYRLRIQQEDGIFITGNLRPSYTDLNGDYVKIDRTNNRLVFGEIDRANTLIAGIVKLADADDISSGSTNSVVSPNDVYNILLDKGYDSSISSINGSILDINSEITNNINPSISALTSDLNSLDQRTVKKTDKATTSSLGVVKVDGTTITIDSNGTIHGASTYTLPTASTNTLGGVKIDGTTITIDANGVISSTGTSYTAGDGILISNDVISIASSVSKTVTFEEINVGQANVNSLIISDIYTNSLVNPTTTNSYLAIESNHVLRLGGSDIDSVTINKGGTAYTNIDSGNISTDAYIVSLVNRIIALETQINGGNA